MIAALQARILELRGLIMDYEALKSALAGIPPLTDTCKGSLYLGIENSNKVIIDKKTLDDGKYEIIKADMDTVNNNMETMINECNEWIAKYTAEIASLEAQIAALIEEERRKQAAKEN